MKSSFSSWADKSDKELKSFKMIEKKGRLISHGLKKVPSVSADERIEANTTEANAFTRIITYIRGDNNDAPERHEVMLAVSPRRITIFLFQIVIVLFSLSLMAVTLKYIFLRNDFFTNTIEYFFDSSLESNVPTIFSSLILFIASLLLFTIFKVKRALSETRYMTNCWLILSLLFTFLCVDESSRIHEQFSKLTEVTGEQSGYMHNSWIIPYGFLSLATGAYFVRFLLRLPKRTKIIFIVSGCMYVASALGFEMVEGHLIYMYHGNNIYDKLLCSFEEMLEMSSIVFFIYGLLDYLLRNKLEISNVRNRRPSINY